MPFDLENVDCWLILTLQCVQLKFKMKVKGQFHCNMKGKVFLSVRNARYEATSAFRSSEGSIKRVHDTYTIKTPNCWFVKFVVLNSSVCPPVRACSLTLFSLVVTAFLIQ